VSELNEELPKKLACMNSSFFDRGLVPSSRRSPKAGDFKAELTAVTNSTARGLLAHESAPLHPDAHHQQLNWSRSFGIMPYEFAGMLPRHAGLLPRNEGWPVKREVFRAQGVEIPPQLGRSLPFRARGTIGYCPIAVAGVPSTEDPDLR
jgi:hypothetical protein